MTRTSFYSKSTILTALCLLAATRGMAQTFKPGDLAVLRVGDGTTALSNNGAAVNIDQYSTAGAKGFTIALPTATSGANKILTQSGSAGSEGALTVTSGADNLVVAGYNIAPNTTAAVASGVVRGVGVINTQTGAVNTSTSLNTTYNGSSNNIRSAASADGVNLYTGGTSSTVGVGLTTLGNTTNANATSIVNGNVRDVNVYNNNLYLSTGSSSGSFAAGTGIYKVGTGLPTASATPVRIATATSPYDFLFASANTLYVADDGAGVLKYDLAAGTSPTETLKFTLGGTAVNVRNLTFDGTNFYATTTAAADNDIITFTDPGASGTIQVTSLAHAGANYQFRGIRLVPEPSPVLTFAIGALTLGGAWLRRRKAQTITEA